MEQHASDFLPTASIPMLRLRARLLATVRRFFDDRNYWEVETPLLSHDTVIDAYLDPFVVPRGHAGRDLYLQTSPEFAMKRLLAAGADFIYQVTHAFRQAERGTRHNPEFTMVEWYRVGDTAEVQMTLVEDLVRSVWEAAHIHAEQSPASPRRSLSEEPFPRTTYAEAFARVLNCDVHAADTAELTEIGQRRGLVPPPGLAADDLDGHRNWLLAEFVEPVLGRDSPEFLCDYPATQGALAKIRHDRHPVAERFELYCDGVELCNGYQELTDAAELRRRNIEQSAIRARDGSHPLPQESRLLHAMDAGFPESAGVALGFDRLVMLAVGATCIEDVIPFPIERA